LRILGCDPGAIRFGIACIETDPLHYIDSLVLGLERGELKYQPYREALIEYWLQEGAILLDKYMPDLLAMEIIPAVSSSNFVVATQSQLANSAATTLFILARQRDIPVKQIGASSVKKKLTGNGAATKPSIRNSVIEIFEELAPFKKEKKWDEWDAIAIALSCKNI
jgi:Holliday junction resolvasome RuvABC endonuclease subunit